MEDPSNALSRVTDDYYYEYYFYFEDDVLMWKTYKTDENVLGRIFLEFIGEVALGFDSNIYFVRIITFFNLFRP